MTALRLLAITVEAKGQWEWKMPMFFSLRVPRTSELKGFPATYPTLFLRSMPGYLMTW